MGPADRSQYKCPTSRQEGEECFLGFHTKSISQKVSENQQNTLSNSFKPSVLLLYCDSIKEDDQDPVHRLPHGPHGSRHCRGGRQVRSETRIIP